jgi:hypothetical protein
LSLPTTPCAAAVRSTARLAPTLRGFRCGNNRYYGRNDQDFCHATDVAHYAHVLTRADFVGGAAA